MKKLRISKIWIAVVVIVIVAVAAWAMSGGKKEEDINFKEEKVALIQRRIQRQISCNNQNDKKSRVNTNIYSI